ncbi:DUF58 domain-containing protein [Acanthopleuribacter pedis]|uniref:DUF58 domain-containing protein n=1 Tax=Acanthopleuribacter pedis TaxID=442870 RepID=A0A8J7U2U1_9BACT|nr:DUF58 domain-containing protein [Acanthopleuribacter pedis]MBO1319668.1 DUF58 domain-containing protein [Acanthopleuribacter pedis]
MWTTLILYGVSYLTTNSTIFLFSSIFSAILVYSFFYLRFLFPKLDIKVRNPSELFAGRDGSFEIHLKSHNRRLPFGPLEITFVTDQDDVTFQTVVPSVPAHEEVVHTIHLTPKKRGRLKIIEVYLQSAVPFGLFARRQSLVLDQELLIFPEILDKVQRLPHSEEPRTGLEPQQSEDFQYLSPYQSGDDIRMIHWRKSATSQIPIVRRDFQKKERVDPRIFLADTCPHFEYAIKVMATWVVEDQGFDDWAVFAQHGLQQPTDQAQMLAILAEAEAVNPEQAGNLLSNTRRRVMRASELHP